MSYQTHHKRSNFIVYVLSVVIGSVIVLAAGILYLQVTGLTKPHRNQDMNSPAGLDYQEVMFRTEDDLNIAGWYIPGRHPHAVILVHGIHANRAYLMPQAKILSQAGYAVLLIDLRGHGYSEGELLTYGYSEALDVYAAVDYLLEQPEIDQVAALGHSLGGAAVVRAAAADARIKAVVIQSSFCSLPQAIDESFNRFALLPKRPFAPLVIWLAEKNTGLEIGQVDSSRDLAAMAPRPVLIIHSADDSLFPLHHAERMYEAAQEPKDLWVVEGLPHVNPISGNEAEYKTRLLTFLNGAFEKSVE